MKQCDKLCICGAYLKRRAKTQLCTWRKWQYLADSCAPGRSDLGDSYANRNDYTWDFQLAEMIFGRRLCNWQEWLYLGYSCGTPLPPPPQSPNLPRRKKERRDFKDRLFCKRLGCSFSRCEGIMLGQLSPDEGIVQLRRVQNPETVLVLRTPLGQLCPNKAALCVCVCVCVCVSVCVCVCRGGG